MYVHVRVHVYVHVYRVPWYVCCVMWGWAKPTHAKYKYAVRVLDCYRKNISHPLWSTNRGQVSITRLPGQGRDLCPEVRSSAAGGRLLTCTWRRGVDIVCSVSAYEQPVWAKSDTPQLLAHMKCERPPCERTPPALKTRHSEQLIHFPPPTYQQWYSEYVLISADGAMVRL